MTQEALKLALEFIENSECGTADLEAFIKEALAQLEQEPVAYYQPHKGFYFARPTSVLAPTIVDVEPLALYTSPPQRPWVGLTDEERADCWSSSAQQSAINIEAKLKEKNL